MEATKPFKETKVGKFLQNEFPQVLNTVGDVLPSNGVFGIVKNLIKATPGISPAQQSEAIQRVEEFEKEFFQMEMQDRDSARSREIEVAKTNKHDWLMYVVGGVILFAFLIVVYASVFMHMQGETFVRISTMVETLTVAIVSYYYGSSKSSADKTKLLGE